MKKLLLAALLIFPVLSNAQTGNTATVQWTAPTQFTDGSALVPATDLTGYNVYVDGVKKVTAGSTTTVGPSTTSYVVTGLSIGSHTFGATAVAKGSGAESAMSNVATKTVLDTRVPKPPTLLDAIIAWIKAHFKYFA